MRAIIPGINVKVFGRAIHSLAKIGEELYIEPLQHGLALRTVNSSRSAYACFLFTPAFFLQFDDGSQGSGDNLVKCKITMKSILTVFKSLMVLEKTVDKCKISLDLGQTQLVFQLHCRHGIVKTHNLAFIECETLQAVFSKDLCPNILTAPSRLLCDIVMNFQTSQEEISLTISPLKASFNNYVDDEPDPNKVMHTQLNLEPGEFDNYQVGIDTEITFCLKELRAILGFCEVANMPLAMHFETAGKPIVLSLETDPSFEGHFVLATLASNNNSQGSQSQRKQHVPPHSTGRPASSNGRLDSRCEDTVSINEASRQVSITEASRQVSITEASRQVSITEASRQGSITEVSRQGADTVTEPAADTEITLSPVIPVQGSTVEQVPTPQLEQDDEEDECVPGTPPSKKFKSLFFGWSQSTVGGSQPAAPQTTSRPILAEDTDEED